MIRYLDMRTRTALLVVAIALAAFVLSTQPSAQADTFGSGGDTFTIDFVSIGDAGNAPDPLTGYGVVPYEYRIGKYEISLDQIRKATSGGLSNVVVWDGRIPDGVLWLSDQPGAFTKWYEAAAFVNWLNISKGHQAAYNLTYSGNDLWNMALWSSEEAWTQGGANPFRHKGAHYFLPAENEWYKAAYFNPTTSNYFIYPTGSDKAPVSVASGTDPDTAVYGLTFELGPALVMEAGGLSPYGTMGQGGNIWEYNESAFDGTNDSPDERRVTRGGIWTPLEEGEGADLLKSSYRGGSQAGFQSGPTGFRVASVPEPSTYALLLMTGAGALWWARRRQTRSR